MINNLLPIVMKSSATFYALFFLLCGGLQAQTIYGIKNDPPLYPPSPGVSTTYLTTIDPTTGQSTMEFPIAGAQTSINGSLTFDHERQAYVYWGVDTLGDYRFYSVRIDSSGINSPLVPNIPGIGVKGPIGVEYDLSTGATYGIINVYQGGGKTLAHFVSVDLITGNVVVIDTFSNVSGPFSQATSFDSNQGRYIFQSRDANNNYSLYFLDAATGQFVKQLQIQSPPMATSGLAHFEYDNNTDQIFAIYITQDRTVPFPYENKLFICEVDTGSGALTNLTANPVAEGLGISSQYATNDFEQQNREYLFVHTDPARGIRLKIFDLDSLTLITDTNYDTEVRQLLINNHAFAVSRYGLGNTVGVSESLGPKFSFYPNPVKDELRISWEQMKPDRVVVMDLNGRTVLSRSIRPGVEGTSIDLQSLSPAAYFLALYENGNLKGVNKFLRNSDL